MKLISKALFSLFIAVPSWFALFSSGHEIQVRIPVWNVGNIFSNLAKGNPPTTRPPTRSTRPTRATRPSGTPPTKPTDPSDICEIYPQLPACQEETTPEPSICDIYPQLPICQEETNPPEPSICDTYPQLPICQEETNPPEPSLCDTYPELPICQEETNPSEPSICDTYPQLPLCQEENLRQSDVGDLKAPMRAWVTDPTFCLYYPNSCWSPEESPIVPGVRGKKLPAGPTRRPAWQRHSNKYILQSNQNK